MSRYGNPWMDDLYDNLEYEGKKVGFWSMYYLVLTILSDMAAAIARDLR